MLTAELAADEHDAAPAFPHHARQVMARHAHAAHHVQLEEAEPVLVGDLRDALDAVVVAEVRRPHVVHEDVGVGSLREDGFCTLCRREISSDARDVARRKGLPHLPHCVIDAGASTAVDDDRCAGTRQSFRGGATDARR